jgi:hypothetical protein
VGNNNNEQVWNKKQKRWWVFEAWTNRRWITWTKRRWIGMSSMNKGWASKNRQWARLCVQTNNNKQHDEQCIKQEKNKTCKKTKA